MGGGGGVVAGERATDDLHSSADTFGNIPSPLSGVPAGFCASAAAGGGESQGV